MGISPLGIAIVGLAIVGGDSLVQAPWPRKICDSISIKAGVAAQRQAKCN
jgi:hypothetical protein